jgi:hypothetical protein
MFPHRRWHRDCFCRAISIYPTDKSCTQNRCRSKKLPTGGAHCNRSRRYRENIALSKYADRQWWLWGLGFPVAMIAAIFVSMVSGQLPSVDLSGFVEGSIILFVASAIMAMLMIVLQQLAFLPASIAYAYFLARTSAAMTGSNRAPTEKSRRPVFRLLLIGIPAGVVLGLVITLVLPSFSWFAGIEVAWGLVFGAALALPAN